MLARDTYSRRTTVSADIRAFRAKTVVRVVTIRASVDTLHGIHAIDCDVVLRVAVAAAQASSVVLRETCLAG